VTGPVNLPQEGPACDQTVCLPGHVRTTRWAGRIRVLETWYDEDPSPQEDYDLWISHQRTRPVSRWRWLYFYTLHVDLRLPQEQILANMRKNYVRDIKAGETKDGLVCEINPAPTEQDLTDFTRFYDANPGSPDQQPAALERYREFWGAGLIHLSQVRNPEGGILAAHCLLCLKGSRTIQLSAQVSLRSGDQQKSLGTAVGRANRWLFYREFLYYKGQGLETYDLNGWYAGVTDQKRLQINQFKEGFRGRLLYGFDCEEPKGPMGWLYVILRAIQVRLFHPDRMRDLRRRRKKAPRLPEPE